MGDCAGGGWWGAARCPASRRPACRCGAARAGSGRCCRVAAAGDPVGVAVDAGDLPAVAGVRRPRGAVLRRRVRRGAAARARGATRRASVRGCRLGAAERQAGAARSTAAVGDAGEQSSLFEIQEEPIAFEALLRVYADQLRRHQLAEHPDRMRLLTASESSGMLVAAEMDRAGLPWSAETHRALLTELLGERFAGGGEPRRLTELAEQISEAFGRRVRPELPADVLKAFKQAGHQVSSTRKWELERIDHPAVAPLLEYKTLYRIYTANGWTWLQRLGPRRAIPARLHPGRHGVRPLDHQRRWRSADPEGDPPRGGRRSGLAAGRRRRVAARAARSWPRSRAIRGLMEVAGDAGDLYKAVSDKAFSGDRAMAKLAVLGAIYGQTSGDGLKNLAALRKRFPKAVAYVDDAARAGEEGRLVRTWLGRTCPPSGVADRRRDAGGSVRGAADRRAARPGPRPLHQELRRPGQRGRLGAADDGRAAPVDHRAQGRAGLLPARRGDRALPGRGGRARSRPRSRRPATWPAGSRSARRRRASRSPPRSWSATPTPSDQWMQVRRSGVVSPAAPALEGLGRTASAVVEGERGRSSTRARAVETDLDSASGSHGTVVRQGGRTDG